ncbi:hypothetical protein E8E13_011276 [Curvularia kusanoi]|uniref:F-box domain-containing protein n=1 Tax=Curvularia kusanoi TaxID=90978 RepID=A0A9P4TLR0_CURKU|nr:hypothetical protein E8E13_011276 [Curvularia kusanoi]
MVPEDLQHAGSCCPIQNLSPELVLSILDYLPFPATLDLACTCKQLEATCQRTLERHQDSYRRYRYASDLDPGTVTTLLRSAFGQGDPIPAWHVRSFEVWRDRTAWSEWKTLDHHTPLLAGSDNQASPSRVSNEDIRRYLYWFEEQVNEDFSFDLIGEILAKNERGFDGLLKALLFAKLENLHDLTFVTRSQESGSCLSPLRLLLAACIKKEDSEKARKEAMENSCKCEGCTERRTIAGGNSDAGERGSSRESALNDAEGSSEIVDNTPWPIGFRQIRRVAVGVQSGTWMDDGFKEVSSIRLFCHLLRIPDIDSIYFKGLRECDEGFDPSDVIDYEGYDYREMPKGSSSVKHMFLDGRVNDGADGENDLWKGPRQLLTVALRHNSSEAYDGTTGTANSLARNQKQTLQSLMWYGYTKEYCGNIIGDRCAILDNEEFDHFKRLPSMKQMSVCMYDIDGCVGRRDTYARNREDPVEGRDDDDDDQGNIYNEEDEEEFIARRIATMFPRSIETIVFWDAVWLTDTRYFELGIIKMLRSGRYKFLKSIFLEAAQEPSRRSDLGSLHYQAAVAAGREVGVDVYTLSNYSGMQHTTTFVEAPDEYDLKTGIHSGLRPEGWIFDSYLGRRIPPESRLAHYHSAKLRADYRNEYANRSTL